MPKIETNKESPNKENKIIKKRGRPRKTARNDETTKKINTKNEASIKRDEIIEPKNHKD